MSTVVTPMPHVSSLATAGLGEGPLGAAAPQSGDNVGQAPAEPKVRMGISGP